MELQMCPICGTESMEKKKISQEFEYKGHKKTIYGCEIIECKECGESFSTDETSKMMEKIIRDFHREVDGLLTSKQIKKIRTSIGFTQKDFGNLLGGGTKAFAKYESGVLTQSRPMDNLIRVIDQCSEAIEVLRDRPIGMPIKVSSFNYKFKQDKPNIQFRMAGGI